MSDDLQAIRERAEREELERHEAEREAARAERRLQAELNRPPPPLKPNWATYRSTLEMDRATFSLWCETIPRPKLGPPPPPPAPPPARPPVLDKPALARSIASGIAEAIAAERKVDLERIATLEHNLGDVTARLNRITDALLARGLAASEGPIDLPPLRLSSHGQH